MNVLISIRKTCKIRGWKFTITKHKKETWYTVTLADGVYLECPSPEILNNWILKIA